MQAYDADFYPVDEENRKQNIWKTAGIIACVLLIGLLCLRVYGWNRDRHETRLLVLINEWNSYERADFKPELEEIDGGFKLDRQCVKDFRHMMCDCRDAGCSPKLVSAYRDRQEQERLYAEKTLELEVQGQVKELTVQNPAHPGRSEHELGLAADIVDEAYPYMDSKQADTKTCKWLRENSWQYGFILRYPEGQEESTGFSYQPWHYRYVGIEAARQIHDMDICLEKYIEMFYSENAVVKIKD